MTAHGAHLIAHAQETAARLGDDCCTEEEFLRAFEDDMANCAACTGKYTEPDEEPETPDESDISEPPHAWNYADHPASGRPSRGGRGKRKQQIYTLTELEHRQWYSDDARISDAVRDDVRSRVDAACWLEIWDACGTVVWYRQ